jgi:hypothetical protein
MVPAVSFASLKLSEMVAAHPASAPLKKAITVRLAQTLRATRWIEWVESCDFTRRSVFASVKDLMLDTGPLKSNKQYDSREAQRGL